MSQFAYGAEAPRPADQARRISGLDGLRGMMTILVIVSHYFGELEHGVHGLMFGWIAVDMFFVLSGFLIGKLILDKRAHQNFFAVFYVRRFCRILPAYFIVVLVLACLLKVVPASWADAPVQFPLWSYLTFSQGFFMVGAHSIGAHWLAPTWTLAVEEYFYLLIPAAIFFTPRRWLAPLLLSAAAATLALRVAIYVFGFANHMVALALLPGRADVLVCGVLAAVAVTSGKLDLQRWQMPLRLTPLLALIATFALRMTSSRLFDAFGSLIIAVGCAAFILCIVGGAPEAKRFESRTLQFFGNNGYCLYLTHLPVLGLVHGLLLGTRPDLATPAQWMATLIALPIAVLVGWGLTKAVEEPLSAYGRTWRWSDRTVNRRRWATRLEPAH